MKKFISIFLLVIFLVACNSEEVLQPNESINEVSIEETEISTKNTPPEIILLEADETTLCMACSTSIKAEITNLENDALEYSWTAEQGVIEGNNDEIIYHAPEKVTSKAVDIIILKVSDGLNVTETSLPILLIADDQLNSWVSTKGPYGGNIKEIEVSTNNPEILYAAGGGGKVYKTITGGEQWMSLGQVDGDGFIRNLVFVESGGTNSLLVIQNESLYISMNDGETWEQKDELGSIIDIEKSLDNPEEILLGSKDGKIYHSSDGGRVWQNIGNLNEQGRVFDMAFGEKNEFWVAIFVGGEIEGESYLYHTDDGGETWHSWEFPLMDETRIWSIYVDKKNKDEIYIGLNDLYNRMFIERTSDHVFMSTDHGISWTTFSLPFADAMVRILGKPINSEKLYIASGGHIFVKEGLVVREINSLVKDYQIGDPTDIAFDPENEKIIYMPLNQSFGIRKSLDGGVNWQEINNGLDNTAISLLTPYLAKTSDINNTYLASSVGGEGVFITNDFGENWQNVTKNGIEHPWMDEIQVSYDNLPKAWLVADVGKVFVTTDQGASFQTAINPSDDGFKFGSIYAIASYPKDRSILYALKNGFGIYKSIDAGENWTFLENSEVDYTFTLAISPENPDIIYSGYSPKPFQNYGMIRMSEDGGNSWKTSLKLENSDGITSVIIDPQNPNILYAGNTGQKGELWTSTDNGVNWHELNPSLNFTNIHVMESSLGNPNTIFGGVWGGGTYTTVDNGKNWQPLKNDPTISASAILLNPNNQSEMYISDRTAPKVYYTDNDGNSWETIFDGCADYYRVLASAISPSNPKIVYISVFGLEGPFSGDVFRIENGISRKVTGELPRLPVGLVVDPNNSEVVFAISHAGGVFKTTNGGEDWINLSTSESGLPDSDQVGYNMITISPFDPDTIFLLAGSDITGYDLQHVGTTPNEMFTVYRSTDSGLHWENLSNNFLGEISGSIKDIAFDASNPKVLYLAAINGIFQTIDDGQSWKNIFFENPSIQVSNVVLSGDGKSIFASTLGGGIYVGVITANGVRWDDISNLTVPIQNIQINIHPENSNVLFASSYPGGIFKTVDGGKTWAECNFGLPSFSVADPTRQGYYAIKISQSEPDTMYLGIYGVGLYKSEDGGNTWIVKNGDNRILSKKHIYSLFIDPKDSNKVLVSSSEGVFKTLNGGGSWTTVNNGLDGTQIRVLESGDGVILGGTLGNEIIKLDNQWNNWTPMESFKNYGIRWPIWNDRPLYQYTTILFNPKTPNIILIGTFPAGIYKSTDGGLHFVESNYGWTRDGVFSLVYNPDNDQIIYAGTYNGINRSINQGDYWEVWNNGWPAEQWVFSIAFDNEDSNIMYACSKNGENEGQGTDEFHGVVMKSLNGGETWLPIMNGLSYNNEFYKIIVDKFDSNILYLASQLDGIFISRDSGETWQSWNEGLGGAIPGTNGNNVTNTMTLSNDGTLLFLGTNGEGIFRRLTATLAEEWENHAK